MVLLCHSMPLFHTTSPEHPPTGIATNDIEAVVNQLKEGGIYEATIKRTQERFESRITESWMGEKEWELLSLIDLYDRGVAEHCVHTYELVKEKVTQGTFLTGPDGEQISLYQHIENYADRGITVETVLRASLLHDVGKITLPHFMLENTLTYAEWKKLLEKDEHENADRAPLRIAEHIAHDEGISLTEEPDPDRVPAEELLTRTEEVMKQAHLTAKQVLPAYQALTPAQIEELEKRSISPQLTFMQIFALHEEESEQILALSRYQFTQEAKLAGRHHNYKNRPAQFPWAEDTLTTGTTLSEIVLDDIVTFADIEEALQDRSRAYLGKEERPLVNILAILIDESRHRHHSMYMCYLWVRSEFEKKYGDAAQYFSGTPVSASQLNERERGDFDAVIDFLKKYPTEHQAEQMADFQRAA